MEKDAILEVRGHLRKKDTKMEGRRGRTWEGRCQGPKRYGGGGDQRWSWRPHGGGQRREVRGQEEPEERCRTISDGCKGTRRHAYGNMREWAEKRDAWAK